MESKVNGKGCQKLSRKKWNKGGTNLRPLSSSPSRKRVLTIKSYIAFNHHIDFYMYVIYVNRIYTA